MHPVHNTSECEVLMERGWKNRATGATAMNAESSRSHALMSVIVEQTARKEGADGGGAANASG